MTARARAAARALPAPATRARSAASSSRPNAAGPSETMTAASAARAQVPAGRHGVAGPVGGGPVVRAGLEEEPAREGQMGQGPGQAVGGGVRYRLRPGQRRTEVVGHVVELRLAVRRDPCLQRRRGGRRPLQVPPPGPPSASPASASCSRPYARIGSSSRHRPGPAPSRPWATRLLSTSRPMRSATSPRVASGVGRLRGGQVEAAHEHGQPAEQGPLVLVEQVVAPPDDRAERAVPLVGLPTAGEQAQLLVQRREQALGAERGRAGRGQLDRQRHAVEPGADPGHRRRVGREVGRHGQRPVQEQPLGVGVQGQRPYRCDVLTGQPEPLPARGEDRGVRTLGQHPLHERADLLHEMLAVVEHEQ